MDDRGCRPHSNGPTRVKFLLDMGMARSTVRFLRRQGHDTVHLRDQGLQELSDQDIMVKVRKEERIILTHDLDFVRIIALSQQRLPSVITLRLGDMRPDSVNHHPVQVIAHLSEQLREGALVSVNERAIRTRSLPVGGDES